MKDIIFDITIEAGSDYPLDISYTDDDDNPVDLTGWTIDACIREETGNRDCIPFRTWADSAGLHLFMSRERTAGFSYSRGIWDMFIMDPLLKTRTKLMHGRVDIKPDTARRWR